MTRKKVFKLFTIADFEREEVYLRQMHQAVWKVVAFRLGVYTFEKVQSEDVIYQLDFKLHGRDSSNKQLFEDNGWEYVLDCNNFSYFRKPASQVEQEADGMIYSDISSKLDMLNRLMKQRFLLFVSYLVFLGYTLFNSHKFEGSLSGMIFYGLVWLLFILYLFMVSYTGFRFWQLYQKYQKNDKNNM